MSAVPALRVSAPDSGPTVDEIIDRYLRHSEVAGVHGAEALAQRRTLLGEFAALLRGVPVADCKAFQLSDWIEDHKTWKSSSTRKAKANQVNAAFNWALKSGRIDKNPFASVDYAEAPPRPPMPDAVLGKVELLSSRPFEQAAHFLRLTGCRLSELCDLDWSDVDLTAGLFTVRRHKSLRKTGKPKIKVLTADAVQLLRELQEARKDFWGLPVGPVFLNTAGTRWTRQTLGQYLLRLLKRHKIQTPARLHGLRHQFGTSAVRAGAPIKLISLQMGHSSVTTTERYYLHLDQDTDAIRRAAELASLPPPPPDLPPAGPAQ